jgi:hypothetical protein
MHKDIKRFWLDGTVSDTGMVKARENFERMLIQEMRSDGFVPVLDLGPYWSTSYDATRDNYNFALSIYGVYVGKEEACKIEGMSDGKPMPRYIPKSKSRQS